MTASLDTHASGTFRVRAQVPACGIARRDTMLWPSGCRQGRVLVLGAGGAELRAFADARPGWTLMASIRRKMLTLARRRWASTGRGWRCIGHDDAARTGRSMPPAHPHFHFIAREQRLETLRQIRRRLRPGAPLSSPISAFRRASRAVAVDRAECRFCRRVGSRSGSGRALQ